MKLTTTQKTESVKLAGLAALATALVSFGVTKLVEIELNFWMLLALIVVGIGVFVYLDLRKTK